MTAPDNESVNDVSCAQPQPYGLAGIQMQQHCIHPHHYVMPLQQDVPAIEHPAMSMNAQKTTP